MQLKQHIKSLLILTALKTFYQSYLHCLRTQNVRRKGLVWRGLTGQRRRFIPKAMRWFNLLRAEHLWGGKSIAPEKSMNKSAHGTNSDVGTLANWIPRNKAHYSILLRGTKIWTTIPFAHGIPIGRQACAHCAIAGAGKNAVRPAKKQCEMYN